MLRRRPGLVVSEAVVAVALALLAAVWAYADPYTSLGNKAVLLRVLLGVVVSVGLSALLLGRGDGVLRRVGWAVVILRAPVLVLFPLGYLPPQITSELL